MNVTRTGGPGAAGQGPDKSNSSTSRRNLFLTALRQFIIKNGQIY